MRDAFYELFSLAVSVDTSGSCQLLTATHENPVDYCVRLNEAAERADVHLQRCGSKMENMSLEITMMLIRNCPNPELSNVFRSKPISKWLGNWHTQHFLSMLSGHNR